MASNLAKSGYETVVYDLKADAVRAVERDGARAAASVEELADQVDVLGICVVYDWQVRELLSLGGPIVRGDHDGLVVLVHSTLSPSVVREVAATAAPAGITVLDAPVSGGHQRSVDGKLSVMVGGDARAFERCRSILSAVGTSVQHVGAVGDGQVVKLANNAMLFANQMAMMEALRFADDQGVARETVLDISGAPAGSPNEGLPAHDLLAQARSGLVWEHYSDRPLMFALRLPTCRHQPAACPPCSSARSTIRAERYARPTCRERWHGLAPAGPGPSDRTRCSRDTFRRICGFLLSSARTAAGSSTPPGSGRYRHRRQVARDHPVGRIRGRAEASCAWRNLLRRRPLCGREGERLDLTGAAGPVRGGRRGMRPRPRPHRVLGRPPAAAERDDQVHAIRN